MTLLKNLILTAILFLSINSAAQNVNSYLSNHAIDISNDISHTKNRLDSTFFNNQLFLLGEIHGIQKGQDVDYDMVTLLNREVNLNTYIAEFDFAKAYFLNQYLQTGAENLMNAVFEDWVVQDLQWGNKDFQNKIRRIRLFNQQLQPNQKIYFEGIDQIQNTLLVARYLKEVLKDPSLQKISSEFNPLIAALEAKNDSLIIAVSTSLIKQIELNKQLRDVNKAEDLRFALKNCALINSSREALLHDNFVDLFKMRDWKNKKLYGFFGFAHILQSHGNNGKFKSLALRLEQDENLLLKGKILSIAMLYVDSKMMMPTSAVPEAWQTKGKRFSSISQYNHDGPLINLEGIADLKKVTRPNTITLFNLKVEGSPYLRKSVNIKYADMMPQGMRLVLDENGKYTTDYFQYIVLVRNSESTKQIEIYPIGKGLNRTHTAFKLCQSFAKKREGLTSE